MHVRHPYERNYGNIETATVDTDHKAQVQVLTALNVLKELWRY
jgi:hypothetical protein